MSAVDDERAPAAAKGDKGEGDASVQLEGQYEVGVPKPEWISWRCGLSCRELSWSFRVQEKTMLVIGVLLIPPVLYLTLADIATKRPFDVNDPTISYEVKTGQVSTLAAAVWPVLDWVMAVMGVEYLLYRVRHREQAVAFATFIHFSIGVFTASMGMTLTYLSMAVSAGILRPAFLTKCAPDANGDCTAPDSELDDLRRSFPSGHAAYPSMIGIYTILYSLWSLYARAHGNILRDVLGHLAAWKQDLVEGVINWVVLGYTFFVLFYVPVTRIQDNKHSTADVTAGIMIGAFWAPPMLFRYICVYNRRLKPALDKYVEEAALESPASDRGGERDGPADPADPESTIHDHLTAA